MSDKDLNKKVDDLAEAKEKYMSANTVISIGGYEFTPAKLMIAATIVSSTLGGLYGVFEVYKDYQSMKKKIAEYVTPDLTEVHKKLAVIEENSSKTNDYTRDIKNDLKNDIRRLEGVVEQVERSAKQSAREATEAQKEVDREIRTVRKEIDNKIQKALDNPLAGK
jgi:hypothetical protein